MTDDHNNLAGGSPPTPALIEFLEHWAALSRCDHPEHWPVEEAAKQIEKHAMFRAAADALRSLAALHADVQRLRRASQHVLQAAGPHPPSGSSAYVVPAPYIGALCRAVELTGPDGDALRALEGPPKLHPKAVIIQTLEAKLEAAEAALARVTQERDTAKAEITSCVYCGDDIRKNPSEWGDWEDRETHYSCASGPNEGKPHRPLLRPSSVDDALDIYVPGAWRCLKCGFALQKATIFVQSGTIGSTREDVMNVTGEVCPNDGEQMTRETWHERAEASQKWGVDLMEEIIALTGAEHLPAAVEKIKQLAALAQARDTPALPVDAFHRAVTVGIEDLVQQARESPGTLPAAQRLRTVLIDHYRSALEARDTAQSNKGVATMEQEPGEMHWKNEWMFKRMDNGDVRIRKGGAMVAVIPAAEWVSLIHHLSRHQTAESFQVARELHGDF